MNLHDPVTFGMSIEEAEAGGKLPPGWYKAMVSDVGEHQHIKQAIAVTYRITEGPFANGEITDAIRDPEMARDVKASKRTQGRMAACAQRLGLWDGQPGTKVAPWGQAIGRAMVIEVVAGTNKDEETGKKVPTGFSEIEWLGMYPPDHEKIPDAVRKTLALPPARVKATPAAGQGTAAAGTGNGTATATAPAKRRAVDL